MDTYTVATEQKEAKLFYRYYMAKAGWTEAALPAKRSPACYSPKTVASWP